MDRLIVADPLLRKTFDVLSVLRSRFPAVPLLVGRQRDGLLHRLHLKMLYGAPTERLRTVCEEDFIEDMLALSKKYASDRLVIVPVEERFLVHFYAFLDKEGWRNFVALLPSREVFERMRDKKALNGFCLENGFGAPLSYTLEELAALPDAAFPLLAKPCLGSGGKGIVILENKKDLTAEVLDTLSQEEYVIQELLPCGREVTGAFFLMKDGECVGAYAHRRIRTSPEKGGVTVCSELVERPDVITVGAALLRKAGWEGLVMLEYLQDPRSGEWKVIEANPRIWGSVLLGEYAGYDLLTNYVNLCLGKPLSDRPKKTHASIRWFFPMDLYAYGKSGFRIKHFWNLRDTCLINWTFAPKGSAIWYNLTSLFRPSNIKRFLHR